MKQNVFFLSLFLCADTFERNDLATFRLNNFHGFAQNWQTIIVTLEAHTKKKSLTLFACANYLKDFVQWKSWVETGKKLQIGQKILLLPF